MAQTFPSFDIESTLFTASCTCNISDDYFCADLSYKEGPVFKLLAEAAATNPLAAEYSTWVDTAVGTYNNTFDNYTLGDKMCGWCRLNTSGYDMVELDTSYTYTMNCDYRYINGNTGSDTQLNSGTIFSSYGTGLFPQLAFDFTCTISANFPIFRTQAECTAYMALATEDEELEYIKEHALNYMENEYVEGETKDYYIYNNYGSGTLLNGSVTPVSGTTATWKSLRFKANKQPVIYLDGGNSFAATLRTRSVVTSYATSGPPYTLDSVPESQWPQDDTYITANWITNTEKYANAFGTLPPNGNYTYGFTFNTNIPVFSTQEEAEEALYSGDYSKAVNFYDIDNLYYEPPMIGQDEDNTSFGDGAVTSPFVSTYLCDRTDVLNVASAFYSNNSTIIDNIKKGLELFGSEPFQALCGLRYFPCDLSSIVNTSSQNYIYFGSYQHTGVSVDKVINLVQGGYIDAGTVTLTPVQNSYRSFEPYCGLSVYLPYIGWQKLRIADYWGKVVNVRYYIDIYTGACVAALVANNVFIDYFTGQIGVELPITGQMLSQYANSALNGLLGTAGGAIGGAASGAMLGGTAGLALGPAGVAALAVGGAAAGVATGVFRMAQKGAPKDHNTTKGSFTSAVGTYMPQYVIFRWEVHDLIIPDLLTDLYGRPSAASGKVSSFSGFLQCDTIKLNTTGMNDAEASEVASLLREGVFV